MAFLSEIIGGGLILGVMTFAYLAKKDISDAMGELKTHCKEREHSTVRKEECHNAMNSMVDKFKDLQGHLDKRLDDLKDLIQKNGKY